jgi:predicted HAD superfamily phosphohydrolase YqeG
MNYTKYLQFYYKALLKRQVIITQQSKSVFDIDYTSLRKESNLIIFDYDDTLVDFLGSIGEDSISLLNKLKKMGFDLAVFSNCTPKRAKELMAVLSKLNVYNVTGSDKPSPRGFIEAINHFKTTPEKTIAVGDKLGTEMYGAYLANIKHRIIVNPFSYIHGGQKANFFHRCIRKFEKVLYYKLIKYEKQI